MSIDYAATGAGVAAPLPGKKVGLVGLGAMGGPIAINFLNAGQPLVVRDADPSAQDRFAQAHSAATPATDVSELSACDVVVLVLPNSDIVDRVVLGENGILAGLKPGSIIIDMGSSVPARTQALADAATAVGVEVVDAPVSGGVTRALKADLAIMVGGTSAAVDAVTPLLTCTGSSLIRVGPVGSGHAAKALNNLLSAIGLVAAAEVLLVGRKFGIDASTLLTVINASSGRNQATETKYEKFVLSQTYGSGFGAGLMRKDIGIALDLARTEGVPTALGDTLGTVWGDAVDSLQPGADHTEVVRYIEQLAGVALTDVHTAAAAG